MSNVLLEGAATGRPLITSDIPGCREAVENGVSGLLCKVRDVESLYQAMTKFLSKKKEACEAMGKAGRKKMEKEFEKIAVVKETIAALGLNK